MQRPRCCECLGLAVGITWALLAAGARAQDAGRMGAEPEPAQTSESGPGCFPECRRGYVCHQAECISGCNPPCDSGEVCDGTQCVSGCNPPCARGYACSAGACDRTAPSSPIGGVWLDLAVHAQDTEQQVSGETLSESFSAVSPVVRAAVPVTDNPWTVDVDLPLTHLSFERRSVLIDVDNVDDTSLRIGNVTAGASYHVRRVDARGSVGFGAAFPTSSLPDDGAGVALTNYGVAAAMRGNWNLWWYLPEALALFGHADVRSTGPLDVGTGVALGLATGVSDEATDTAVVLQSQGHVGYASKLLETGLRLRGVFFSEAVNDGFQASFEPYVMAFFGGGFLGAGLVVNIDEPAGPLLDDGSVWALRFYGGARF